MSRYVNMTGNRRAQHKRPGRQAQLERRLRALARFNSWMNTAFWANTAPPPYFVAELRTLERRVGITAHERAEILRVGAPK